MAPAPWASLRPSPRPDRVGLFVLAVGLAAAGALWFDVWASGAKRLLGANTAGFVIFAVCCMTTEVRPLRWLRSRAGAEITASWTFMFALILSAPPVAAVAVAAAAVAIGEVVAGKGAQRIVFNAAQIVVSLSAGVAVMHFSGQAGLLARGEVPSPWWLLAVIGAAAVMFVTNQMLICTVLALHTSAPLRRVVADGATSNLSTDGMLLALSPVFVIVSQRSLLLVPLLLVTTWSVYRSAEQAALRRHEATHDQLTGLPNRRLFDEHLQRCAEAARAGGRRVGLMIMDLNGFKAINDRFGHQAGDDVLREVAKRLDAARRPADLVARLGGDEFAVVISEPDSPEAAVAVAEALLSGFDRPCLSGGFPLAVRPSAGLVIMPDHAEDPQVAVQRADMAMYEGKTRGGGVVVHTGAESPPAGQALLADLSGAVSGNQFFLLYQPKIDLATRRVIGVEALLRWAHPRHGLVAPAAFMSAAENTELIGAITEWVLGEALRQCRAWRDEGIDVRMAVNVSTRDLSDPVFPALVHRLLEANGLTADRLELEIKEDAVGADGDAMRATLGQLREAGVSISVDDFGTGYSSMGELRRLPVDELKIDASFVSRMAVDAQDASIVNAIVGLGNALNLKTVAEGVEDQGVAEMLRALGVQRAQGYHFAYPMPAHAVATVLRAQADAERAAPPQAEGGGSTERMAS